jgi:hypothetical protein
MRLRTILVILIFFVKIDCFSQPKNRELVLLAEVYHKYHFQSLDNKAIRKLNNVKSPELNTVKEFISESIKPNNNILSTKYLKKPSIETLNYFFIILHLNYNMFNENKESTKEIIEKYSLSNTTIDEMLVSYYNSVFGLLYNKNPDIVLSGLNFDFKELQLNSNKEKSIFFLTAMERMGVLYNSKINVIDVNDSDRPEDIIKRYPMINNKPFYEFNEFDFDDFLLIIDKFRPRESYKNYYLGAYMKLLKFLEINK